MSHVTQQLIADAFKVAQHGLREAPINIRKTSTKYVYLATPGECIDTYIDHGDTIMKEVSRVVPIGSHIVICDNLKNSTEHFQKYFIPFDDFSERYTLMNGEPITSTCKQLFKDMTQVRAKGTAIAFKALPGDAPDGKYEQPPSWGPGIASGADDDGYWMASTQKPDEWYFMPTSHFIRDYVKIH